MYDKTQPENLVFLERLRALLDEYPGTTSVGEVGDDDSLGVMAEYTQGGKRLHMCYSFNLLTERAAPEDLLAPLSEMEERIGDGWPCWALGNHDVTRLATRWGAEGHAEKPRLYMAFLLTQRGSVCLYQREELGLTEAELTFDQLVDPAGITFWPSYKGRDGCRTPMPWQADAPLGGFCPEGIAPWLPVFKRHLPLAVDRLDAYPDSLLNRVRQLLTLRGGSELLRQGEQTLINCAVLPHGVFVVLRHDREQRLLCLAHLGHTKSERAKIDLDAVIPDADGWSSLSLPGMVPPLLEGRQLTIEPGQAAWLSIA